jgi:multidrug efflux pump subunit AcrB
MYQSFRVAIAMLITSLLALSVVFVGLWITGREMNISSMMGMIPVVPIVENFRQAMINSSPAQSEAKLV